MGLEYHPENLSGAGKGLGFFVGALIGSYALLAAGVEIQKAYDAHTYKMKTDVQYRQAQIEKEEKIETDLHNIRMNWAKYGIIGR